MYYFLKNVVESNRRNYKHTTLFDTFLSLNHKHFEQQKIPVIWYAPLCLGKYITLNINCTLLTLHINENINSRYSYTVVGWTSVWPWHVPLYVLKCFNRTIWQDNVGTVNLVPFPYDIVVWVGSGYFTLQSSCFSLFDSKWIWCTWCHFWFIYYQKKTIEKIEYTVNFPIKIMFRLQTTSLNFP